MICDQCMEKTSFMQAYLPYSLPSQQICTIKKCDTNESVDVQGIENEPGNCSANSGVFSDVKSEDEHSTDKETSPQKAPKRKLSEGAGDEPSEAHGETSSKKLCEEKNSEKTAKDKTECIYQKLLGNEKKKSGCTYWKNGWRAKLCSCQACKLMYKEQDVEFLMDESDTIISYEDRGQSRREQQSSSYDSSLNALNSLGRVQQIEILHGYNDMKTQLTSYLADFAKEGKGSVFFALPDGNGLLYNVTGVSEAPKAISNIARDIPCKTDYTELLTVSNWLKKPQRY
ncbi:Hypothetical predicted protein [Paramuricea clavata]|uniref:Uncharacterized protein n=1 Tax=Paramuricea clavata TaxID=317549 RepID=A0A7D9E2Q1_PARCT|nr:Hypothetical predicted protein [Paramuricea clavata]